MQNSKQMRTKFYLVLIIFLLPLFLSGMLYHFHEHFPLKTTNHGTLVNPPLNIQNYNEFKITSAPRKWQIVYVNNETCGNACQKISYQLHQIQKALGKDHTRVNVITLQNNVIELQNVFRQQGKKDFVVNDKIYLIDPIGNLFMYYPSSTHPMNILKDLKKVLGVSQIG